MCSERAGDEFSSAKGRKNASSTIEGKRGYHCTVVKTGIALVPYRGTSHDVSNGGRGFPAPADRIGDMARICYVRIVHSNLQPQLVSTKR